MTLRATEPLKTIDAMKRTKTKSNRRGQEPAPAENRPLPDGGELTSTSDASAGRNDSQEVAAVPANAIDALRAKNQELEDAVLRTKADYQNFQRRSAIERADAVRFANADVMRSVVSVIDDLERSLEAAKTSDNLEAVVDGVQLVYDNLQNALRAHGLERIEALHQPFDPNVHEAMLQQPTDDHPAGTVIEEIAPGYRLRDRVLRPSKVIVSKAVDAEPKSTGAEAT